MELQTHPFAVTAVGSFPGTDIREVTAIVAGELSDFPLLPELPNRGPGGDMIGRTVALLSAYSSSFAATTTPTGWRLAGTLSGNQPKTMRVGQSWLNEDLDCVEEQFQDYRGPFKVQLAGPWTVASVMELPTGEPLLSDAGAVRDLIAVTTDVAVDMCQQLSHRIPGAVVALQFDEPMLERVIDSRIRRQSGVGVISTDLAVVRSSLTDLAELGKQHPISVGVHTCATRAPIPELVKAGFDFLSVDFVALSALPEQIRRISESGLAEFAESANVILVGLAAQQDNVAATVRPFEEFVSRTGIDPEGGAKLVLTPRCGLAGSESLGSVRSTLTSLLQAQCALSGMPADDTHERD